VNNSNTSQHFCNKWEFSFAKCFKPFRLFINQNHCLLKSFSSNSDISHFRPVQNTNNVFTASPSLDPCDHLRGSVSDTSGSRRMTNESNVVFEKSRSPLQPFKPLRVGVNRVERRLWLGRPSAHFSRLPIPLLT
jgi:hypothetical protein